MARRIRPVTRKDAILRFLVNFDRDETGMTVAECPATPGHISRGKTEADATAKIREAIQACLEARAANGMPSGGLPSA